MGTAIDMDYCIILIEKLISPMTPSAQVEPLLRDLMDSVYHPEMKKMAQRIVDPELDISDKRRLMEEFRTFNHGGDNDYKNVDYNALLDKFLDPNTPDHEYKPTMKALLEGDLDQEKKNMVINIINCVDADKKANMVKRFKSFFDREKEEKERLEKERKIAKAAKEKAKRELEQNLLVFDDDGMQLVMKMIDKKIPADKRTQLYDRLMEPDIDADIKNLAITLLNAKKSEYLQTIEDFKKRREEEKLAAAKRKEEAEKRRQQEEEKMKNAKMMRKQQLLAQKDKDERMKKRELMLKFRAEERKRGREGLVGPSSVAERDEWRRREKEKVLNEMRKYKEMARQNMYRQEREDRLKESWLVTPWDDNFNIDAEVRVPDLLSTLSDSEKDKFERALVKAKAEFEGKPLPAEEKPVETTKMVEEPAPAPRTSSRNSSVDQKAETKDESKEEDDDEEFKDYFTIFSNPELTEKDEVTYIKKLIADKKSSLVRKLVQRLASVEGVGKSTIFKTLAKKFAKDTPAPAPAPDSTVNKESNPESSLPNGKIANDKVVEKKSKEPEKVAEKDDKERQRHKSSDYHKSSKSDTSKNDNSENKVHPKVEEKKRHLSSDNVSNDSKRAKIEEGSEENNENKIKEDNRKREESSHEKSKKKKHKHKDEERDKDGKDKDEKNHKKHKHKDKSKHKEKHKKKDKDRDKDREEDTRDQIRRTSTDSVSSRCSESSRPTVEEIQLRHATVDLSMSITEMKKLFKLNNLDSFVKIKNCRGLYHQVRQAEQENGSKRSRSSSSESVQSNKKKSQPYPTPSSSKTSVKSRSPSRSRSRSTSRSPVRYVSRTPSRSTSRSPVRYVSRSRSRSISTSPFRSPSRSPSP